MLVDLPELPVDGGTSVGIPVQRMILYTFLINAALVARYAEATV